MVLLATPGEEMDVLVGTVLFPAVDALPRSKGATQEIKMGQSILLAGPISLVIGHEIVRMGCPFLL